MHRFQVLARTTVSPCDFALTGLWHDPSSPNKVSVHYAVSCTISFCCFHTSNFLNRRVQPILISKMKARGYAPTRGRGVPSSTSTRRPNKSKKRRVRSNQEGTDYRKLYEELLRQQQEKGVEKSHLMSTHAAERISRLQSAHRTKVRTLMKSIQAAQAFQFVQASAKGVQCSQGKLTTSGVRFGTLLIYFKCNGHAVLQKLL